MDLLPSVKGSLRRHLVPHLTSVASLSTARGRLNSPSWRTSLRFPLHWSCVTDRTVARFAERHTCVRRGGFHRTRLPGRYLFTSTPKHVACGEGCSVRPLSLLIPLRQSTHTGGT